MKIMRSARVAKERRTQRVATRHVDAVGEVLAVCGIIIRL